MANHPRRSNAEIDVLIDAEFGEPIPPEWRRQLRADVRKYGNMVVFKAGSVGECVDDPTVKPSPMPEVRTTPELVLRARHLGWTGAQMTIEAIKRARPDLRDIEFTAGDGTRTASPYN
jgi:hypothetical protein